MTDQDCGKVIGRKGEELKKIEDMSGARVQVQNSREVSSRHDLRYVEIAGNSEEREKAREGAQGYGAHRSCIENLCRKLATVVQ